MINKRYIPDLPEQNALSEANFLRLERLLGDMSKSHYAFQWGGEKGQRPVRVRIDVQERFKFTTTLTLCKDNPALPEPLNQVQLTLRMYHDARMAEVVTWAKGKQMSGVYPYPNEQMYQIDEKAQANQYLGEWLAHLMQHGVTEERWQPASPEQ